MNQIAPKRRRLSREQRRVQLLACAVKAFARQGLSRATHQDVAEEAGITTPAVFFYFPTRRDLVDAALIQVEEFMLGIVRSAPEGISPRDSFLLMAEAFAKADSDTEDLVRIWLDWSTSFRDDVWPRYLRLQEQILSHERSIIERGQREGTVSRAICAEDAARIIHGEAHMIALMMFERRDPQRLRDFLLHLIDSALGIAQKT